MVVNVFRKHSEEFSMLQHTIKHYRMSPDEYNALDISVLSCDVGDVDLKGSMCFAHAAWM